MKIEAYPLVIPKTYGAQINGPKETYYLSRVVLSLIYSTGSHTDKVVVMNKDQYCTTFNSYDNAFDKAECLAEEYGVYFNKLCDKEGRVVSNFFDDDKDATRDILEGDYRVDDPIKSSELYISSGFWIDKVGNDDTEKVFPVIAISTEIHDDNPEVIPFKEFAVDLDGVYYDFEDNTSYKSQEIVNKIATVLASGFSIDLKLMPEVGRRIIKEAITNRKKAQK